MATTMTVPDVVVSTDWVAQHRNDATVRIVEVDVDTAAYDQGHVPGALGWNWTTELCDTLVRDIVPKEKLEALLGRAGITPQTTIVLYGDNNNWFAAWAFWQLKVYGHQDVRLMNGGRKKWLAEGRELETTTATPSPTTYKAKDPDNSIRALLPEVQSAYRRSDTVLVDVRSPQEFSGEILAPPGLPETCQRGGHIPGAKSIPWGKACNEDGTFKSRDELEALYGGQGVTPDKNVTGRGRSGATSSAPRWKSRDGDRHAEERGLQRDEAGARRLGDQHRFVPCRREVLLHDRQREPWRALRACRGRHARGSRVGRSRESKAAPETDAPVSDVI
jgi:thiosulfate/3-mercaptopyruvate sulfurtransferase